MKPAANVVSPATLSAERLFKSHRGFVTNFLGSLGIPERDLEDAVQEVFIIAHRLGGYTSGPAKPSTWLGAIAVRVAANMRRHIMRRTRKERRYYVNNKEFLVTHVTPHCKAEQKELVRTAETAVRNMTEDHRTIFVRYVMEGQSCDHIAKALEIPVGTVYSRMHAVRQILHAIENI